MSSGSAVLERPVSSLRESELDENRLVSGLLVGESDGPSDDLLALYQSGVGHDSDVMDEEASGEPLAEAKGAGDEECGPEPIRHDRDEELRLWMSRARVAQLLTADE